VARVVELSYYPVKGCAGVSVDDAAVTLADLPHDRSFMVTGEEGVFRSQRPIRCRWSIERQSPIHLS
jgi:uncharacterized protein YcbX